jgi:hypothetical protein
VADGSNVLVKGSPKVEEAGESRSLLVREERDLCCINHGALAPRAGGFHASCARV